MNTADLRDLVRRQPFQPFTVHMNDGSKLKVTQPDNFFAPPDWDFTAIIALPKGRFSVIYTRNIAHVGTSGRWPTMSRGRRRKPRREGPDDRA